MKDLGVVSLCVMILVSGCVGARSSVSFDTAMYPVSITAAIPDRDGHVLVRSELEVVGRFEASAKGWGLWMLIPLSGADFSESLNEQVEAAGGEAVTNLQFSCGFPYFPTLFPNFMCLPLPAAVYVKVQGDIVRSTRGR